MIQVDFRTKKNGVPILSKDEIEYIAEAVLQDYNPKLLDNPGVLDVEHFSECYASLEMDYQDLTHDRSILGMTVFNNCYIPVYDPENDRAKKIPVDEGTILIDNSLLEDDQLRRGRFTLGHDVSPQSSFLSPTLSIMRLLVSLTAIIWLILSFISASGLLRLSCHLAILTSLPPFLAYRLLPSGSDRPLLRFYPYKKEP